MWKSITGTEQNGLPQKVGVSTKNVAVRVTEVKGETKEAKTIHSPSEKVCPLKGKLNAGNSTAKLLLLGNILLIFI